MVTTGEGMLWFLFFLFISVLFFAAFGNASVTEDTVEDYINNLMEHDGMIVNRKK